LDDELIEIAPPAKDEMGGDVAAGWVTDVPVVPGTRNEREQALGSLSGGAAASALARQTIVLLDGPDASAVDGAVAQTAAAQIFVVERYNGPLAREVKSVRLGRQRPRDCRT
jgi:hypothetical protein